MPTRLIILLVVALALRFYVVFAVDGYLGVDGGAYLLSHNDVLGRETSGITGPGLPRPMLAPGWLLVPFVSAWGMDTGLKVFAAVSSLVPILAVYTLARGYVPERSALIIATLTAADIWQAEMLVTGTMPLVASGLLMWALAAVDRHRYYWLVVIIPLIALTNQTTAGITLFVLPVWVIGHVLRTASYSDRRMRITEPFLFTDVTIRRINTIALNLTPIIVYGTLGAIIAAALSWSVYAAQVPGGEYVSFDGPLFYLSTWRDPVWIQIGMALAAVYVLKRYLGGTSLPLVMVLAATSFVMVWLSYDEAVINVMYRSRYFIMPIIYLSIVAALWERKRGPAWERSNGPRHSRSSRGFTSYRESHRPAYHS